VADNLKIGSRVRVIARSGLKDDVKDGETVGGYPAMPFRQFARIYAAQKQLPDLLAEVAKLREKLDTLEKAIDEKSGKCAQ
jgi:UDP-3-O-[3-hydroxymyristoyl] glucosamine N-acyltransferase